jgi:hypothetical protein
VPSYTPPAGCPGTPHRFQLAEVPLWRVHDRRFGARDCKPSRALSPYEGGRFDPVEPEGPGVLYLAEDEACAVAESFLRLLPISAPAPRQLPRKVLQDRNLSKLLPQPPLTGPVLLELSGGAALSQVGQDSWLTKCDPREYPATREWGRALRRWAPWAQGFTWRSRLDEDRRAFVLFCRASLHPALQELHTLSLDQEPGFSRVQKLLARYNVAVAD